MAVSPGKITLLDVVEAVIGEIFLNDCILRPEFCNRSNTCAAHLIWEKAGNQLRATLQDATFAKLLQENSCFLPLEIEQNEWT